MPKDVNLIRISFVIDDADKSSRLANPKSSFITTA